ncbi:MAG: divergent polysaccharide deacetylase family protein [Candidatus Omnitrophota bacterium]
MRRPLINPIIAVLLSVFIIFSLYKSHKTDVTREALESRDVFLACMEKAGITPYEIVSCKESVWTRRGVKGMTTSYVVLPSGRFDTEGFREIINRVLAEKGSAILSETYYKKDEKTGNGAAVFEFSAGNNVVLSATFNNVFRRGGEQEALVNGRNDTHSPRIAIVLDDFGYSRKNLELLKKTEIPLTLAVLPNLAHSKYVCDFAEENGMEVILHLPMEPEKNTLSLEKDTLKGDMSSTTVRKIFTDAVTSVDNIKGVNNHMGSKATQNINLMKCIFGEMKKSNLFFLDSYTTDKSVCEKAALETGIPYLKRDIFIDNEADKVYINNRIRRLGDLSIARGMAVGIGHDRTLTIEALVEAVPEIRARGIRFVELSELMKDEKK